MQGIYVLCWPEMPLTKEAFAILDGCLMQADAAISRLGEDRDPYRLKLLEGRSRVECPKTVPRAQRLGRMLNVRLGPVQRAAWQQRDPVVNVR